MMTPIEKITRQLMNYFACVAHPGQVFGPRDFNSQVMMHVFDPEERAALGAALQHLLQGGVLEAITATEYTLTREGLAMARELCDGDRTAARGTATGTTPAVA
jgi:hypothetical protein